MTRGLPRGAGSETTLEGSRPVLIAGLESSTIGRTAHLLEAAGFPAVAIFGRHTFDVARERWAPILAVIDLDAAWAFQAGTDLHRAGAYHGDLFRFHNSWSVERNGRSAAARRVEASEPSVVTASYTVTCHVSPISAR